MGVDCLNLADYLSGRRKKIVMDKNGIPHRFLRQGKSHLHRYHSKLSFITIALFIDFSHLTGDVVTDAMKTIPSVSIQTCGIFSQAAYGVECVFTEGIFYLYR